MPEQDIVNTMGQYFPTVDKTLVQKSWDLAKEKAKETYPESDPSYYPQVINLAKQYISDGSNINSTNNTTDTNNNEEKTSIFSTPAEDSMYTPKKVTESLEDYLDWKGSSTMSYASVRFLINEELYQMEFKYALAGGPQWNYDWKPLLSQGIENVLFISIEQLRGNVYTKTVMPNRSPLKLDRELVKLMIFALETYFQIFNRKVDIQYLLFSIETPERAQFIRFFIKELSNKYNYYKEVEEVGKSLTKNNIRYIAVRNTRAKLKEEDGTVMSTDFGDAIPSDAGRNRNDWKKDFEKNNEWGKKKMKKKKLALRRYIDSSLIGE